MFTKRAWIRNPDIPMTATHTTPGPWRAYKRGKEPYTIRDDRREAIVATTGGFYHPDKQAADAVLIAAAPDLLAALELCECELTLYIGLADQSNNPDAWHSAIDAARAAIAKGRGE